MIAIETRPFELKQQPQQQLKEKKNLNFKFKSWTLNIDIAINKIKIQNLQTFEQHEEQKQNTNYEFNIKSNANKWITFKSIHSIFGSCKITNKRIKEIDKATHNSRKTHPLLW